MTWLIVLALVLIIFVEFRLPGRRWCEITNWKRLSAARMNDRNEAASPPSGSQLASLLCVRRPALLAPLSLFRTPVFPDKRRQIWNAAGKYSGKGFHQSGEFLGPFLR